MKRGITTVALATVAAFATMGSALPAAAGPTVPKGTVKAVVKKVIDGDTLLLVVGRKEMKVRVLEVNAPGGRECWAREATARTAGLLPVGSTAYTLADRKPRDENGLNLRYVWNSKGVFVNRNLIRDGYAKWKSMTPNDRFTKVIIGDQKKAARERLRIWSGKCGGTATPAPTRTPKPPKPPKPSDPPAPRPNATPTPSNGAGGTDRRFRTCGEANAAGYGPYRRGTDPEYGWYQDRDGDGLVCER
ncbi:thermonuclease family protein [Streptosporangium sp. NBC_01756]|uniref:thermonuclease family protein n=1 Tax=Streptosporangium sp. NBC_01756 TaxID=2975950 RepID=UPI002DDA8C25|nr:excalibur calcium-binding domain-containing protein [Streptosporangium sp. NBC_01756]WSC90280.1 excalibur calcium-binding domain-containing protein [Streptosporangium sp. NBC_01756]